MTQAVHPTSNARNPELPVARIQAQDSNWIQPLREYFEQNGCQVSVNRETSVSPLYVIGVGDTGFVKSFFEEAKWLHAKKLAIIYEGDEDDLHSLRSHNIKQYYIDPKALTPKDVQEIFAFFFTGRAISINARKEPKTPKKASVIPREPTRETAQEIEKRESLDRVRVAKEMQQIYHRPRNGEQNGFRNIWRKVAVIGGIVFLTTITPFIFYLLSLAASVGLLALSAKTLTDGNTRWTLPLIAYSDTYLKASQGLLAVGSPLLLLARQGGIVEDQDRLLSILSQTAAAEKGVVTIFQTSKVVAAGVIFPNDKSQKAGVADVINLATEVSRVSQHLALLSAQLNSLSQSTRFPFTTKPVSDLMAKGVTKLTALRGVVSYTDRLLTLYPRIAGFRKKQTYLVLLQNSMELRPAGGFIGSLLVLSFVDGKVETLEVQDVYTADGQLKGHVDPPLPIREILGQEHWYLRDSNWDPQFAVSGAQAAWFYEKELGQSVDGVIAISLPMVTELLRITGPIELLDFNERISEGNFFAKSLLYTETDFFPGSTQKKDFLGALISALLTKITSDASLSAGGLLSVLTRSIQSRDLQFYFPDEELQSLVSQWGWNGGVSVDQCLAPYKNIPCVGDGVGIVDANLGVNKSNFFLKKEGVSQISIADNGDIEHIYTMNVHNSAPVLESGAGTYQGYTRFYVPLDAQIRSITLDGEEVPLRDSENPVPPPAPYWVNEQQDALRVIHVPFAVSPRQTRQLTLRWVRPMALSFVQQGAYQLTLRKQAGVASFPWRVVMTYPEGWEAISDGGVAKPGSLEYNTDLTKDAGYRVLFQKKL